jgi:hypothetical protein
MSVTHHPPPELLAGFAAGTLDAGEHLAVGVAGGDHPFWLPAPVREDDLV